MSHQLIDKYALTEHLILFYFDRDDRVLNYNGEESGVHPQAPRIQYIVKEENAGCKPAMEEKFYSLGVCKAFAYTEHVHLVVRSSQRTLHQLTNR